MNSGTTLDGQSLDASGHEIKIFTLIGSLCARLVIKQNMIHRQTKKNNVHLISDTHSLTQSFSQSVVQIYSAFNKRCQILKPEDYELDRTRRVARIAFEVVCPSVAILRFNCHRMGEITGKIYFREICRGKPKLSIIKL